MRVGRKFSRPTSHIVLSKNVCLFSFFSSGVKKFRRFAASAVSSVKKRAWRVGMERIENRTFDELEPGDTASLARTLHYKDIEVFAIMSGDVNPTHVDESFAKSDTFHNVVAHGMWGVTVEIVGHGLFSF